MIQTPWFWYDEAQPAEQRARFHGQIVGVLGDYFLCRFDPNTAFPEGMHTLISVATAAGQAWCLFETEDELRRALAKSPDA